MTQQHKPPQTEQAHLTLRYYPAILLLSLTLLWLLFFYAQTSITSLHLVLIALCSLPILGGSFLLYKQQQRLHKEALNYYQTHSELLEQRQQISQAIEASKLGLWEWDLETDSIYHSHFDDIFGYDQNEIPHFMGNLQPLVHPNDYPRLRQGLIDALKGRNPHFQCRFRIKHKSGEWRWLEDHGEVVERNRKIGRASCRERV